MMAWFNSESKTIAGAAMLVGVLSLVSRVVGFIRDRILAGAFGAGDVLDAYYAAFKLPDTLFSLLVLGALSASFIPLFSKYYHRVGGRSEAWRFTNGVLNLLAVAMGIGSLGLLIFAKPLSELIAPGFPELKQELVASMTRVMLLAQFILALSVVFGSVLQGLKRFFIYSLAPIFYNLGIMIGAAWLAPWLGPIGLAWGVVLGAFLHFLVQLYGVLQAGYRYEPLFDGKRRDVREAFVLMGPRVLGLAVAQLNVVMMTIIASSLGRGSVTVFHFAYNIQYLPIGMIGISYAIAAFPVLSEHAEKNQPERFVHAFSSSVRQMLMFIVPLTFLFLILRAQIVRVVVGAGAFGWIETIATANTLAFFTLSFFAQCLVLLLARAYFALQDTITPLLSGVVSAVVTLLGSLYFTEHAGVVGLALAYSIGSIVNVALLWVPLRVRLGSLGESSIVNALYIFTGAGLVSGVVMQLLKPVAAAMIPLETFFGVLMQGLFAGGIGLFVYVLIAWLFKSQEVIDFIASVRRRFFKTYQPEEIVPTETTGS